MIKVDASKGELMESIKGEKDEHDRTHTQHRGEHSKGSTGVNVGPSASARFIEKVPLHLPPRGSIVCLLFFFVCCFPSKRKSPRCRRAPSTGTEGVDPGHLAFSPTTRGSGVRAIPLSPSLLIALISPALLFVIITHQQLFRFGVRTGENISI